jgi:hypothetical protein
MPFHNTKQELILEYIIIGFILILKEFRIIWAKEFFKTRKKIILMTFIRKYLKHNFYNLIEFPWRTILFVPGTGVLWKTKSVLLA